MTLTAHPGDWVRADTTVDDYRRKVSAAVRSLREARELAGECPDPDVAQVLEQVVTDALPALADVLARIDNGEV